MTVEQIAERLKATRNNVTVQASITAADAEVLDEFVAFLNKVGVKTNRAATVRALLLDGLEAFKEFQADEAAK